LEKSGFSFKNRKFCRPNGDPSEHDSSEKGIDFFDTEKEFRHHLCRYGLDDDPCWTREERLLIYSWVRQAILHNVDKPGKLPEYQELSSKEGLNLLRKLGFRLEKLSTGHLWFGPGVDGSEGEMGENKFLDEKDMRCHLARHGLPENCDFNRITDSERLSVELWLADMFHMEDTL